MLFGFVRGWDISYTSITSITSILFYLIIIIIIKIIIMIFIEGAQLAKAVFSGALMH